MFDRTMADAVHRSQQPLRMLRPLLFTLGLGAVGALVNYLLLSPLPSPVLYLGGLFYLPVLIRFGFGYALLCATLTQLPLLSTLSYWLPLPELIALGWLIHRRRLDPMRAALWYWLSVGLACTVFIAFRLDDWDLTTRLIALAIPPLSGLVLMALTTHTLSAFRRHRADDSHPIAHQLSDLLVVFACLPILIFHVVGTPSFTREQINKTLRAVHHAEQVSQERYQLLIERNLRGLATIADVISSNHGTPLADFEPLLNRLVGNLPEVFTIILVDQQGIAVAGAPSHFPDGASVKDARQSYQDRSYFQEARLKPEPIVSYGIVGRRMNKEPLLSLVAPIVNPSTEFAGLLLGNLPVRRLQSVFDAIEHRERFDALLYDRKQQVLYSTLGFAIAPLAPLAEQPFFAWLNRDGMPAELTHGSSLQSHIWQGKLLHHRRNDAGDGLVLAYDLRPEMATMARNSLLALLLMLGLILAARKLSQQVGKRLLAPLLSLHQHLQTLDPGRIHQLQPLQIESHTREFSELIRSINGMMIRIAKARLETDWAIAEKDKLNADLDRKIAERTEQLASKAEQLERLSITDALTGLHNRRYLNDQLTDEWQRSRRGQSPFTLMLLDVDHFKSINDRYGHPIGDQVLRQIGMRLLEKIRSIDMAARYGGEEFAVLLPGIDATHALVVAERLRLSLADEEVATETGVVQFTVSIGICDSLSAELTSENDLLQRVDRALYAAKRNGRNRCLIWTSAS